MAQPKAVRNAHPEDPTLAAIKRGEKAAGELGEALKLTGVCFPSLAGGMPALGSRARVELGGMSAEAAQELAAWIKAHA